REAESAEIAGDRSAPDSVVAVDDDLVLGIQFGGAELDLLHRDVRGIVEPAQTRLPFVAHVEQDDGLLSVQARSEILRADALRHGVLLATYGCVSLASAWLTSRAALPARRRAAVRRSPETPRPSPGRPASARRREAPRRSSRPSAWLRPRRSRRAVETPRRSV